MMQEFVQKINELIKKEISCIHTAMPGTIVSFDPGKMTATVQPGLKFKKPDGTTMDYPQIFGVPVIFPGGPGMTFAFPVKSGDGCLIIVAEQSLDYWRYEQETPTDLPFDISNSVCIPGLQKSSNAAVQEACENNSVVIQIPGGKMSISGSGVNIEAPNVTISGSLNVSGSITAPGLK